jgi:hypothetical protein
MRPLKRRFVTRRYEAVGEFEAPKAGRRRQKLYADTLAVIVGLAQEDHTALLLFVGVGICQHDHLALIDFVLQQQQSAVRIHHHRLAGLAEFATIVPAPLRLHYHFVEHTSAAPWRDKCSVAHSTDMFKRARRAGQLTQRTGVSPQKPFFTNLHVPGDDFSQLRPLALAKSSKTLSFRA